MQFVVILFVIYMQILIPLNVTNDTEYEIDIILKPNWEHNIIIYTKLQF